jgi:hypothetical protein
MASSRGAAGAQLEAEGGAARDGVAAWWDKGAPAADGDGAWGERWLQQLRFGAVEEGGGRHSSRRLVGEDGVGDVTITITRRDLMLIELRY